MENSRPASNFPVLVVAPSAAKPGRAYPRMLAHFVDLCVVAGCSLYVSKAISVVLLSLHSHAIAGAGRRASAVFLEAYEYSSGELFLASMGVFAMIYFIVIPHLAGKTPGMGLFGLRFQTNDGRRPRLRALSLRVLGCCVIYGTFGLAALRGLGREDGEFFPDFLSGTQVVME
ncbi:MAG: RDD family protein [Bdellovibrionota bacterium]